MKPREKLVCHELSVKSSERSLSLRISLTLGLLRHNLGLSLGDLMSMVMCEANLMAMVMCEAKVAVTIEYYD